MNALEFANTLDHPVIFLVGNGCPAGQTIAWIPPETELPFGLEEAEGEVLNRTLKVSNLKFGDGIRDWRFSDWNSNLYYRIEISNDPEEWNRQAEELGLEVQ